MTSLPSPRFSIVSAVYGVAGYLEDFIASIEKQTFPLDRVQVVMVDDGSVDGSIDILQALGRAPPGPGHPRHPGERRPGRRPQHSGSSTPPGSG